jgi:L-aspartate oxidase
MNEKIVDVLIIGGGIAGLSLALDLDESLNIIIVSKGKINDTNSFYAQGGVAVALKDPEDIPVHKKDTLKTGCALSDEDAVNMLVTEGPDRVWDLINRGVKFDKKNINEYDFLKEGAHSNRRIMHVRDKTGFSIQNTLVEKVSQQKNISLIEDLFLDGLIVKELGCFGGIFININNKEKLSIRANFTIIASGGAGAVYEKTTNWKGSTGDGVAVAYLAGAKVRDMEFYQFHPTAIMLSKGKIKNFLISESARGEGALIINEENERFLFNYDKRGELAPRDIVARSIFEQKRNNKKVFLDMRVISNLVEKFPIIYTSCISAGINLLEQIIEIVPVAHYMIGGIVTDTKGKTSIKNLYACGEVASTGVHGANRLASNSLLECLVFSHKVAQDINSKKEKIVFQKVSLPLENKKSKEIKSKELLQIRDIIQKEMYLKAGILRNENDLLVLKEIVKKYYNLIDQSFCKDTLLYGELRNIIIVSLLIVNNALKRKESRGTHYREDYPKTCKDLDYYHYECSLS